MVGLKLFSIIILLSICLFFVSSKKETNERHIVVVGGGLAGLSAAIEVVTKMVRLTVIEGEKTTGGNSAKATSGINGCDTPTQRKLDIHDSHDMFYSDTITAGHQMNNEELVDTLVHHSAEAIEFLTKIGIDLSDVNIGGGHSVPRTHWIPSPKEGKPKPVGVAIMRGMFDRLKYLQENLHLLELGDRMEIMLETTVEDLLYDEKTGSVKGVRVRNSSGVKEILADAVILATGGFCNDHSEKSLLTEFAPEVAKYPTTNGPWATGSGIKMARKVGASLIQMSTVQIHPTGFVDPADPKSSTKFLAAEALRGSGALLLNQNGERFANELGTRDYLTGEILKHCQFNETSNGHTAYMLLNDAAIDKFGWPSFNFYWKVKKFFQSVQDVYELEEITQMPSNNVKNTFFLYEDAKQGKIADNFGKKTLPVTFSTEDKLYFATITPVLHYTIGGVEINSDAQVLNKDKKPIPGLYAAGEITGGVHGDNRLSGNSLLECVVFGRIAGIHACTN